MSSKTLSKLLAIFILFLLSNSFGIGLENAMAQTSGSTYRALCDENGMIKGTYCPCSDDPAIASVCGIVRNANITKSEPRNGGSQLFDKEGDKPIYSVREPVGGVTVSIYENDKDVPTGKPFGNLEKKMYECSTTPEEGKYHCFMRRINPGNSVYVVFSCNGKLADMKIVPSVLDFVGLDSDVDCNNGPYTFSPMPEVLTFAERDRFLGCSTDGERIDSQAGYADKEILTKVTDIGIEGRDTRFSPSEGWGVNVGPLSIGIGRHKGAFWEKDCLIRYGGTYGSNGYDPGGGESIPGARANRNGGLDREFTIGLGSNRLSRYQDVEEKCNYDPDGDGNGEMEDEDERTTPFRYDIPTPLVEEEQNLPFHTRLKTQREIQDPKAFAQYNHLVFGECTMDYFLRYYGEDSYDTPISCEKLALCNEINGDPYRNYHTANSFGSTLALKMDIEEIIEGEERDGDEILCQSDQHGEVKISQVQPPFPDDDCTPGTAGCKYKLKSEDVPPQAYLAAARSIRKPRTTEAINDTYSREATRELDWEASDTEASHPDLVGHKMLYSDDSVEKNNSGLTSIRLSGTEVSEAGGIMVNRFVDPIAAQDGVYDYSAERIVWDAGGDLRSICSLAGTNGVLPEITKDNEEQFENDNKFIGNLEDHTTSLSAGHSYHKTEWGVAREADLATGGLTLTGLGMVARDYFDTMHRFASGEAELLEFAASISDLWTIVKNRQDINTQKAFAHRTNDFIAPTPAVYETSYEIAEENFEELFPAYGEAGYPGDAGGAYPWNDLEQGDFCDVHPGPGMKPDGQMRTCKGTCEIVQEKRFCRPFNVAEDGSCLRSTTETIKTPCSASQYIDCLTNQEDTGGIDPPPARQLRDGGDVTFGREELWCNLSRAGPMAVAGDVKKHDHTARVMQEPFDGKSQLSADRISASANYSARAFMLAVEPMTESHKASFVDYATTNDLPSEGLPAFIGGGFGATHRETAGTNAKGFGTGATVDLLNIIAFPELAGTLVEPLDEPIPYCNIEADFDAAGEENWCKAIDPPTETIDLEALDVGQCMPNITRASCPLNGRVGETALRILGAAGKHAGDVPGSLLLAAAVSEGGWLYNGQSEGSKMRWDDFSIETEYNSGDWWGRINNCSDGSPAAQGPFGILGYSGYSGFSSFETAIEQGGYHPARESPTNPEIVIASKCNFLDAAYVAAKLLSAYGTQGTCGGGLNEATVRQVMAVFGQGTEDADPSQVDPFWVDVALNCQ